MTSNVPRSRSKRTLLLVVAFVVILVAIIAVVHHFNSRHAGPGGPGGPRAEGQRGRRPGRGGASGEAPVVAVGTATQSNVPVYMTALGTVIANQTVTVNSQVSGQLMAVDFTEGQYVKTGQLLAQIDPRAYEATLAQAKGTLLQDQAQLKDAEVTLVRYQKLFDLHALAKQTLDTQVATVGQYRGAVETAKGEIQAAQLDVEHTRIVAPIDGYVGLRLVDVGNLITANGSTGVVTITQTNPISVTFSLPQSVLPSLLPKLRAGQALPVWALDQLGNTTLSEGKLLYISNAVDTSTGSIEMKASFANPDEKLFPNQFVNIRLQTEVLSNAVVVPSAAIQLSDKGQYVYIVDDQSKVKQQIIQTGPAVDDNTVVTRGVTAGQRVVTLGVDGLKDGEKVEVQAPPASTTTSATATSTNASKTDSTDANGDKKADDTEDKSETKKHSGHSHEHADGASQSNTAAGATGSQ